MPRGQSKKSIAKEAKRVTAEVNALKPTIKNPQKKLAKVQKELKKLRKQRGKSQTKLEKLTDWTMDKFDKKENKLISKADRLANVLGVPPIA